MPQSFHQRCDSLRWRRWGAFLRIKVNSECQVGRTGIGRIVSIEIDVVAGHHKELLGLIRIVKPNVSPNFRIWAMNGS